MNYGERDGYGQAVGYFGDRPNRVTWKLWGENVVVRFYDINTGKQVYEGRGIKRGRHYPCRAEARTLSGSLPDKPTFTWTIGDGGVARSRKMGEDIRFVLGNGIQPRAEIVPIGTGAK